MAPKKNYPCIRCKIHVKQNDKAIQCYLCEQWVHAGANGCETELNEETYKVLVMQKENGGVLNWPCSSCRKSAVKFDTQIKELARRMDTMEEKVTASDMRMSGVEKEVGELKAKVESLGKSTGKVQEDAAVAVFSEMKERENRRDNIVVHELAEPADTVTDGGERAAADLDKFQELVNLIEVDVRVGQAVRFCKRIGEKKPEKPRPLLLGFKDPVAKEQVLANTRKLAQAEEPWVSVSVVQDLTRRQREEDGRLRKQAEEKNTSMDQEEAKNWIWKVVGRRGQRRLVRARREREEMAPPTGRGGRRPSTRT